MQAALACLLPRPVLAQQPAAAGIDLQLYPVLQVKIRAGMALLVSNQFLAGHQLLAEALAEVEADPERRWPYRTAILPSYGFAELALGRPQAALESLNLSIRTQERIAQAGLQPFARVPEAMETGMGRQLLKIEYGRQLLSAIAAPTAIRSVGEIAFDTTHATAELWFTTARVLHAQGDHAGLARFYRERIAGLETGAGQLPAMLAQEYRHFKIGLLLWQLGEEDTAAQAFAAALRMNGRRCAQIERDSSSMESVWSCMSMRRTIVSAQLAQALRAGTLAHQAGPLLEAVLAAKGGGARYLEALMQQLDASSDERLLTCRQQLQQVEDQLAALPQTLTDVRVFITLSGRRSLLIEQATSILHIAPLPALDLERVQRSLGQRAVIGFFVYAPPSDSAFAPAPPRYLRYSVDSSGMTLRDLGPQAALERLVHRWRSELARPAGSAGNTATATALAQLLLQALPPAVLAAPEWLIDADAALHLLPFDALPGADGQPLALARACHYISSLYQLLPAPAPARTGAAAPACIVAAPAYGAGLAQPAEPTMRFSMPGQAVQGAQQIVPVAPLPETVREARAVSAALQRLGIASRMHQGEQASAQAIESSGTPIVLHVAAHAILGQDIAPASAAPLFGQQEWMDMLLPGRRAGLLLSRAGQADVMLAKDIARLPLHGTQLVVLSACNTGNGTVLPGEGVASLRRAVEMAGARSSITALWSVPSVASTELMELMYGQIGQGVTPGAALQHAKQAMIAQGRPPLDWAGFVFAGSDAALALPAEA